MDSKANKLLQRILDRDAEPKDRVDAAMALVELFRPEIIRHIEMELRNAGRMTGAGVRDGFEVTAIFYSVMWSFADVCEENKFTYKGKAQLYRYLFTASKRKILDRLRTESTKTINNELPEVVTDQSLSPEIQVQGAELRDKLLNALPSEDRELMTYVADGDSYRDIERQTSLHRSTIHRRIAGVVVRLKALLTRWEILG